MKKLLSLLLVAALLVGYLPAGAFAAEPAYYVAGTAELCGGAWQCDNADNKMELNSDGLYEKAYADVPAGKHEFKVTDGTWNNSWGKGGANYAFETTEVQDVAITFNADTKEIKVYLDGEALEEPVGEALYTVAGTEGLCGSGWNPGDTNNKMTLNADGLYEKYFVNVPAGRHEFKVTDGTWSNSWGKDGGPDNFAFVTEKVQNVLITFNADTKEIVVTLIDIADYYVAGTDGLCGVGWDPGYADNKMYLDADGLYKKLFKSVPAGKHECKVTDGTWNNSWGVDGGNYVFETDDVYNVTITFNAETKELGYVLSDATAPDPVVPVEYPITVKVHYYRADGNYGDWEVHMWNGSGTTTVSSTRAFEAEEVEYEGTTYGVTATYYTNSNETWVGFIVKKPDWTKDPDGDRHIDISDVLSGTVHVYAKSGSALEDFDVVKDDCVKGAKIIGAKWDSLTEILTVTTSMPVEGDLMEAFDLVLVNADQETPIEITSVTKVDGANEYILGYPEGAIAKDKAYKVYFNGASCDVTIPNTYSTEEFESQYTYTGNDLGATWSAESTTFRVWAPTAAEVFVNLYESGTAGAKDLIKSVEMTADVNGTWIATVEGDLNGVYYTYSVNIQGKVAEACDPYARTTGVNGDRAMVIDLDSTDPEGWENDDYVTQDNYTDAVIWELHVRDFSIDETSGMVNKGKFLAFTERGTKVPGTDIATGVDYMVDLGVNYVHLLPVYDINSVDETKGGYNWGYDPKNYNVPEGSYSTDPYNGAVRVEEFKQMVQSLHEAGIGVIMDVVYNHVADAGNFCFNQIVPGYFSRIHDDGSYQSNSGCGNDTASERSMVSKYIVDSVLYWAEEYHIDGFRWDLVGLIDYETINAVMEAVHEVNPEIIFYGEGWEMCSWTTKDDRNPPYSKRMTIQPNDKMVNTEAGVFAFFNDTIRNVIHGGVFTATDKGFVCGNLSDWTRQTVIDSYMAYSQWGSDSARVDTPLQTVNYASCHDNYTLFDNFTVDALDLNGLALSAENAAKVAEQAAAYNNLAAAYYITAQGVPFIHAGEEMLRSKPSTDAENNFVFDHNSYSSGDGVNSFKWGNLANEMNAASFEYYKGLIAFRKAHPALRMTEQAEILKAMTSLETGSNNIIAILNNGGQVEDAKILTIINTSVNEETFTLPEGEWDAYVTKYVAGTEVQASDLTGTIKLEPVSVTILVQEAEAAEHDTAVIFYTNDVHTYIDGEISYDNIAWLKQETAKEADVLLVDAGDHIQGTAYGSMDKGKTIIDLMNAAGYDLATLGNHEFDYGMDGRINVTDVWAKFPYVSANFYHEKDGVAGDTVLDAYKVFEIAGFKVAIIGVTTPESFTKSTPAYFQDEDGNYIYGIAGGTDGKALYAAVQAAIDEASKEADIIIALAHLGDDKASQPWTSEELIANTTGLDALIDGHSHSTVPMKEVKDAEGNTVVLTQTGEYFGAIGKMTISADGTITTELVTEVAGSDESVKAIKDAWMTEIDTKLGEVIGYLDVTLDNYDETGRLVRKMETNTGDFAADALYYLFDNMGLDVDVAIMNGGGVRNKTITGEFSYKTAKEIHTFGNVACLQTVTGQQLLDALEWGAKDAPDKENGGFLHVSGITYEIDTSIPSTVQKDEKGVWIGGPTGEYRVKNVKIMQDGEYVDLDLDAKYNLAGYNYTLRDLGDGFAMFDGAVNVLDYVMEDYMVLANYIKSFPVDETTGLPTVTAENSPYGSVYGEGRISIYETIATGWSGYTIWTLTDDGVLTIAPSGQTYNGKVNMRNYWKQNGVLTLPWGEYADQITTIVVEEGVNAIGQMAFYELPNLKTVVLADSVEEIRNYAFKNVKTLTEINLEVVEFIREGAFYGCSALTEVEFAEGVVIEDWAFSRSGVVLP